MARYFSIVLFLVAFSAVSCASRTTNEGAHQNRLPDASTDRRTSAPAEPEYITFRSVETDQGTMVQAEVGDMVFMATELSFLHGDKSISQVRCRNGKIEVHHGKNVMSAERFSVSLHGGPFGKGLTITEMGGMVLEGMLNQ